MATHAFGLDISDFTVKFVKLAERWNGELEMPAFGEAKLPDGIVLEGEIKKEDELAIFLKNNLFGADGSIVAKVETGFIGIDQRTFLRHMCAQNFTQGLVHQVGG